MPDMELIIRTTHLCEMVDVTHQVQEIVHRSAVQSGVCYLFSPHTTAGVTLNENWDPAVREDILSALERLVPQAGFYQHAEGNSPAHVKAILTGFSIMVPIKEGALVLGSWQGIYLAEFDGPRTRRLIATVIAA